jgi:hypothetical protein
MKTPVSRLTDPYMQAAPVALMRAAERARRLAEQTGTRFVVRPQATLLNEGLGLSSGTKADSHGGGSLTPSGLSKDPAI